MDPFYPAYGKPRSKQSIRELAEHHHTSVTKMKRFLRDQDASANLFRNSTYQVDMRKVDPIPGYPEITWLSIKRIDKAPVGEERFRDFQEIKNALVGEEAEAVELYPAETRLVDTCNQYHLWVVNGLQFPFGFSERQVSYVDVGGSMQKPL